MNPLIFAMNIPRKHAPSILCSKKQYDRTSPPGIETFDGTQAINEYPYVTRILVNWHRLSNVNWSGRGIYIALTLRRLISYHIISYHIYIYIFLSGYRDKDNCFKWITNYKETFFVGGVWFRFEVLRAVGIKITIFCDVMPCSSVETLHASKQFYILSSVSLSLFKALSEYSACVNFILLLLKLRFLLLLITVIARKLLSEKNYRPRPV